MDFLLLVASCFLLHISRYWLHSIDLTIIRSLLQFTTHFWLESHIRSSNPPFLLQVLDRCLGPGSTDPKLPKPLVAF
jgi:hypothetical protein